MNIELKKQVKAAMLEYLRGQGYPQNFTASTVISALPAIWTHLEAKGLAYQMRAAGCNYQAFVSAALAAKHRHELKTSLWKHFYRF